MMSSGDTSSRPRLRFLIVGMARSGTSVVQRLLAEMHGVWVPPETHFWRHAMAMATRFDFPLDDEAAREAMSWFATLDSSAELAIDVSDVVNRLDDEAYLWDLFVALTASLSPPGSEILGEKTPDHARWAMQLMRTVPDLTIFGVVRDPREVYRSHLSVPWGIRDPWTFAEKWIEHSRILDDLERLYPEGSMVARYEDIVTDPEGYRSRCAQFLSQGDRTVSSTVESIDVPALYGQNEWWKSGVAEPVAPLGARWQTEVDMSDIEVIEWRASTDMRMRGYEPVSDTKSPPTLELAPSLFELRSHASKAASMPLPIDRSSLHEWQRSDADRARRWRDRAHEVNTEIGAAREQANSLKTENTKLKSDLCDWRDQARTLATTSADLAEHNQALKDNVASWRERAEQLNTETVRLRRWVRQEKVLALQSEQQRLIAVGKLRRMRSRRWWRLGSAMGRWRRSPHRVDRLIGDIWRLVTKREGLPPMPDVSAIDRKLVELREPRSTGGGRHAEELAAAEAEFKAGNYETCLEIVESLPAALRSSSEAQKLSRNCHIKLGEVTKALTSVRLALADQDDPDLRRQVRILVGRLRETEPNWLPEIGLAPPEDPSTTNGNVLHILKESLPFFERGYTMRSHMTLMAQRRAGYEPTVVTSLGFPRDQGFEDFEPVDLIDGVAHHRLDLGPAYSTRQTPYDQILSDQATMTARLAHDVKPELIQAGSGYRGYETALVGLAVARHLSVPMIYEIRSFLEQTWTPDVKRSEKGEYYQRRHDQETRCLQEADFVVTIAEAMRDEIVERGIPEDKIAVVPNVVDIDRFQPRGKSRRLLNRYRLGGRPVLGYISNLSPREGVENLIRAIHALRQNGSDVAGLVVGDGPERERLAALVDELNLTDHFALTGHIPNDQIEDHYALIDLFVVPRIDDRASRLVTPLKPLEAMAMEVPVIAADLPALRELVAPGVRGEVFVPEDPNSLAEVASTLLDAPSVRREHASRAKDWILAERTLDANSVRYRDIIKAVLEGH